MDSSRVTQFCAVVGLVFTAVLVLLEVKRQLLVDTSDLTYRFEEVSCARVVPWVEETRCVLKISLYNQGKRRADDVELEIPYGTLASHYTYKPSELVSRGDGQVIRLFNISPSQPVTVKLDIVRRAKTEPNNFTSLDVQSKDGAARQVLVAPWDLSFWDFIQWPLYFFGFIIFVSMLWDGLATQDQKRRRLLSKIRIHQEQLDLARKNLEAFDKNSVPPSGKPEVAEKT